ncbi:ArsR/SmtB family transcription factor [Streptantibioticus ferralitis]|uniref:Helix-turn-helix domain-containing protein n=1 Tax=Streptantibioticus ferralitis TaxID=236510 RepID=A0ABT5YTX1_9ACTN|nr:helix-turn-helix domain-containing protein [Streptantibioticus ferralitis]MDF2254938.1 helix-turn-helix domain-containing protein [Streptantibioticus ferralitis]
MDLPQGQALMRIELDARALGHVRFALSPLHTLTEALLLMRGAAAPGRAGVARRVAETLRARRLDLLAALFGEPCDYIPDFITPRPVSYEESMDGELHRIATARPAEVREEMALLIHGGPGTRGLAGSPVPRPLLRALRRGERVLAEQVAAELAQLWQTVVHPHWPGLRARMEADIAHRAQLIARQGMVSMLVGLHPWIEWGGHQVRLAGPARTQVRGATSLLLVPRGFGSSLITISGSRDHRYRRQPLLMYPALPVPDAPRPAPPAAHELLGSTRAILLADVSTPRTTAQLAGRHGLSKSTVSYHLGVLHRGGLVTKTRDARQVLYQRTHRADRLLLDPSLGLPVRTG